MQAKTKRKYVYHLDIICSGGNLFCERFQYYQKTMKQSFSQKREQLRMSAATHTHLKLVVVSLTSIRFHTTMRIILLFSEANFTISVPRIFPPHTAPLGKR